MLAATTTPTFNSTACPTGFNGSGHLYFIDPTAAAGTTFGNLNKDEISSAILGHGGRVQRHAERSDRERPR